MANQGVFVVGDVVVLKSGGPRMTVCSTPNSNNSSYRCEWFDDSGELKRSGFPGDAITSAAEPKFVS